MTQEQFEKLMEYEQELRWAYRQNFLSMGSGKFGELMVIYKELYNSELSKAQKNCGTCRLNAVKRIATDYFAFQQKIATEQKEERTKSKKGRPKKMQQIENELDTKSN